MNMVPYLLNDTRLQEMEEMSFFHKIRQEKELRRVRIHNKQLEKYLESWCPRSSKFISELWEKIDPTLSDQLMDFNPLTKSFFVMDYHGNKRRIVLDDSYDVTGKGSTLSLEVARGAYHLRYRYLVRFDCSRKVFRVKKIAFHIIQGHREVNIRYDLPGSLIEIQDERNLESSIRIHFMQTLSGMDFESVLSQLLLIQDDMKVEDIYSFIDSIVAREVMEPGIRIFKGDQCMIMEHHQLKKLVTQIEKKGILFSFRYGRSGMKIERISKKTKYVPITDLQEVVCYTKRLIRAK